MIDSNFMIEDKLREIFCFLSPLANKKGMNFNPYFTSGPQEDINPFLVTETAKNIYPLIWLVYPYTESRDGVVVKSGNIRLILALENGQEMLNQIRLESSYKGFLYPLFYNIKELLTRAKNTEVLGGSYELTKFPNYGNYKSETVDVWDALAVDFGIRINKFAHKLN